MTLKKKRFKKKQINKSDKILAPKEDKLKETKQISADNTEQGNSNKYLFFFI